MIRKFKIEDTDKMISMIHNGNLMDINEIKSYIEKNRDNIIVNAEANDANGINGFACFECYDELAPKADIQLYVEPKMRRKGIGSALHHELMRSIEQVNPSFLRIEARIENQSQDQFYKKLGYEKWYGSHEMKNENLCQQTIDINLVQLDDKYLEQYIALLQACFYKLREENDIQPYLPQYDSKSKENMINKKESIYLLFDNEQIIASIMIEDQYLDRIVVLPSHQGKGIGKVITKFGINKALERGCKTLGLTVLESNTKAISLYTSLDFVMQQSSRIYRKFIEK